MEDGMILVTGGNGFVGAAVCRSFASSGAVVRAAVRASDRKVRDASEVVAVGEIGIATDWVAALKGVDTVIHTVARVHQMRDCAADPLAEYRAVNVAATERLARAAAARGVRRFVFISSVKVNGESRPEPYTADDLPAPRDPYGVSKWEAEQRLEAIANETELEVIILRPPLVYGPGVRGNFLRLLELVSRGVPLPFGAVSNRRSLVFVGNLANAALAAARAPTLPRSTYLVSDGVDLSTPELVEGIARTLGREPRLLAVSPRAMRVAAGILGKTVAADKLLGSLSVDSEPLRSDLGWRPPYTVEHGLRETAAWFRSR
jgi:nucleoside-diphosphate-sugar epimerase